MLDYMKALLYPFIDRFVKDEEGQGLVEYALIIAVVAVLIIGSLIALRTGIGEVFADIVSKMKTPTP